MLGVPGQYKSVALMLAYKLDFSCCANKDGFTETITINCIILCAIRGTLNINKLLCAVMSMQ